MGTATRHGYREGRYWMPPEWLPHRASWLAWPQESAWAERTDAMRELWVRLAAELASGETVGILVAGPEQRGDARRRLRRVGVDMSRVDLVQVPTDDCWLRDSGPIFVYGADGAGLTALDWRFNAWGGKYEPWADDDRVAARLARHLGIPTRRIEFVLEGGSIDVDGSGLLLTTESCLLHPNRNPGVSREEIEVLLEAWLGARRVIWLGAGIAGDDTDGHVDDIARFVAPGTVLAAVEEDPCDENYAALRDNFERLQRARDVAGRPLQVIPLCMPEPLYEGDHRLPASYANFYVANSCVLVPVFGQRRDREALEVLQRLFPRRRVVGIRCEELITGLGAIHCITQQEPMPHPPPRAG